MNELISVVAVAGTFIITVVGTLSSLVWWLSKQFTYVRRLIHEEIEKVKEILISKIEYHEQHDDQRFIALSNDIWELKVRNAAKDGHPVVAPNKPIEYIN